MPVPLTELQRVALRRAMVAARSGEWIIATGSGDRVTLASMYRRGYFQRRTRRGREGERDAAYEYTLANVVQDRVKSVVDQLMAIRQRVKG